MVKLVKIQILLFFWVKINLISIPTKIEIWRTYVYNLLLWSCSAWECLDTISQGDYWRT